jgi:membrane fusion protein (multidrug efflux system)
VLSFKWIKHRIEYAVTDAVFVESDSMANLSFYRVKGKVVRLLKKEGDYIKKGEVLAIIDDTDYRIKLSQIEKQIQSLQYKKKALEKKYEKLENVIEIKIKNSNLSYKQTKTSIKALIHQIRQIRK